MQHIAYPSTGFSCAGHSQSRFVSSSQANIYLSRSDGPQPHHLNIHFGHFASVRALRIYLDFDLDESYTPTKIAFFGGTAYHDLIEFATMTFVQPKGWITVPLEGVGGGQDGNTLRAFVIQVRIVENHQNGKDTHLRGVKIYAADERAMHNVLSSVEAVVDAAKPGGRGGNGGKKKRERKNEIAEPDWMGEPEIR